MEENSFTTSKGGPYSIDRVIELFYDDGVTEGALDKKDGIYHHYGKGTESKFKPNWTSAFGIPNNDKAKKVYQRALQKYKEGYDEGWNF